jgi:hypothetical protein
MPTPEKTQKLNTRLNLDENKIPKNRKYIRNTANVQMTRLDAKRPGHDHKQCEGPIHASLPPNGRIRMGLLKE